MKFNESRTLAMEPDTRPTGIVVGLRAITDSTMYPLGLEQRRWVVGTRESCDIVVSDPCVSSVHCVIERLADGSLVVRDHRSRNGTRVNGCCIEGAELKLGSTLTIGSTMLVACLASGHDRTSALAMLRGRDPVFRATVDQALRAAQTDCSLIIVGETGTGKDVLARAVHEASRRAGGPFVAVNCGGIPRELIGSELFGHERGSFTGAHTDRDGYFVEANGGTLFLDELGELPLELQPHLLRAIETRRVRRVGGSSERDVDVRIIAATNRFDGLGATSVHVRADLYHRLATMPLALPPLRERMGDLPDLVTAMLEELAVEHGMKEVSPHGWTALNAYEWPGNVRELRHAVARAVALGGRVLGPTDFFPELRMGRRLGGRGGHPPRVGVGLAPHEAMMRGAMEEALATFGSIRAAASHLGMAKSTFADKARAWGLVPPREGKRLLRRGRR